MKSQLEANTYGIGQLITQRKMFVVPEHQRTFAWSVEEIEQYLTDITGAKDHDAPDYSFSSEVTWPSRLYRASVVRKLPRLSTSQTVGMPKMPYRTAN